MALVLVCGDLNVDLMARLAAPLAPGGDNLLPEFEQHLGGVGANVAISLARGGVDARLLACVGRDAFGEFALQQLRQERLDSSFVQRTGRGLTGLWIIPVNPDGQRTLIGSRGANDHFAFNDDDAVCLGGATWVHLVGQTLLSPATATATKTLVAEAGKRGLRISLDVGLAPAQQQASLVLQVAAGAGVLFVGYDEAVALTGLCEQHELLTALTQLRAPETVLKLGARGSMIREAGAWREVPPITVRAVDTTGAGDAFAAGYIRGRLSGLSVPASALLASAAGAAASSVLGAGERMPDSETALRLLRAAELPSEWHAARDEISAGESERI